MRQADFLWLAEDEGIALPSLAELIRSAEFGEEIRLRLNGRTGFCLTLGLVIEIGPDFVELYVYDIDSARPQTWSRVLLADLKFDFFVGADGMCSIATCLAIDDVSVGRQQVA